MRVLKVLLVVAAAGLVVASGAAAYAALQSCALNLSLLSDVSGCPTDEELAIEAELARLETQRNGLRSEIAHNEREIGRAHV